METNLILMRNFQRGAGRSAYSIIPIALVPCRCGVTVVPRTVRVSSIHVYKENRVNYTA